MVLGVDRLCFIERAMVWDLLSVKSRELQECDVIIDTISQLSKAIVLVTHEDYGSQHLGRSQSLSASVRIFQTSGKIATHQIEHLGMFINNIGDGPQNGIPIHGTPSGIVRQSALTSCDSKAVSMSYLTNTR